MSNKWTTRALGRNGGQAVAIDESLLEEPVVVLLEGKNTFGDQIFSYLQLTMRRFDDMTRHVKAGGNFNPSDYGTVIAAGRGTPSDELRAEMEAQYHLVELPKPSFPASKPGFVPKAWGDEETATSS